MEGVAHVSRDTGPVVPNGERQRSVERGSENLDVSAGSFISDSVAECIFDQRLKQETRDHCLASPGFDVNPYLDRVLKTRFHDIQIQLQHLQLDIQRNLRFISIPQS